MKLNIKKVDSLEKQTNVIVLADKPANLPAELLSQAENDYILKQYDVQKKNTFEFNKFDHWIYIQFLNLEETKPFKRASPWQPRRWST